MELERGLEMQRTELGETAAPPMERVLVVAVRDSTATRAAGAYSAPASSGSFKMATPAKDASRKDVVQGGTSPNSLHPKRPSFQHLRFRSSSMRVGRIEQD